MTVDGGGKERGGAGLVVVIDDDPTMLATVARLLRATQFDVRAFSGGAEAMAYLDQVGGAVDAILTDLRMPGMDGMAVLAAARDKWPEVPVLLMTANATVESAVEAMRLGAYHYVVKPFAVHDEVSLLLGRAVERKRLGDRNRVLERQMDMSARFADIVGSTQVMREVFAMVDSVAPTDVTVLILGESGTGKELVARAIHDRSRRSARPFVAVNCSALTETLLESELFGHVRGAFTGASSSRRGVFEEASGGTLFLDEVGDISPGLQVRLLRALQEGEIKPVGANEVRKVDVRVIAATNKDLERAIEAGEFREDLFYRINVLSVELPPLRARVEDIALLGHHFLAKYAGRHGRAVSRIDGPALEALAAHRWPGNVRELENVIQRAVVLARGDVITLDVLPRALRATEVAAAAVPPSEELLPFAEARARALAAFEQRYLEQALRSEGGNLARAAKRAGLDKSNFRRIVKRHQIDLDGLRAGEPELGRAS